MIKTNRQGFTLIELLVVIAIIGILSTMAVVALNSARTKARDAKRVSDIKQVQTALELYFADKNGYPTAPVAATGCTAGVLGCGNAKVLCSGTTSGFTPVAVGTGGCETTGTATVYMGQVPANAIPAATGDTVSYTYSSSSSSTYQILFVLEGVTGGLSSGTRTASPTGIQ